MATDTNPKLPAYTVAEPPFPIWLSVLNVTSCAASLNLSGSTDLATLHEDCRVEKLEAKNCL